MAERVAVVAHTSWSAPALAGVGKASLVIVIVASLGTQPPLLITHLNTLAPTDRLATCVIGLFGALIEPEPVITTQVPVPTVGVLPVKVAVVKHTLKLLATVATVGEARRVTVMSALVEGQAVPVIVQRNTLAPKPRFVTAVVALFGLAKVAPPLITVQVPVPKVGELAVKVVFVTHTV
ncbi:MAG: hypothetical protein EAY75_00810 [Bacteroidetes bacterium]|nr:MAG: hypothetical protein EAY75_00810 [Bacteroidota bacterium]